MDRSHSSTELRMASARPESSWTNDSNFTDSAVDMDATASSPLKSSTISDYNSRHLQSLSPISQSLADRMRRLAATAWTLEQDDEMSDLKRQDIEKALGNLEDIVESRQTLWENTQKDFAHGQSDRQSAPEQSSGNLTDKDKYRIHESDIFQIHDELAATVACMRLRQQEQRHLHRLTASKLEAVAQRCLFQEQQMQDLVDQAEQLRIENQALGQENDKLREAVAELESEALKKEVAVSAMTSAVAGLEGWIDDADKSLTERHTVTPPIRGNRQRRSVVRGKGRFRKRYYVDEEDGHLPSSPDARDLQDGVKAWIRGFRDVEDACNTPVHDLVKEPYRGASNIEEDDWGEFESPGSAAL